MIEQTMYFALGFLVAALLLLTLLPSLWRRAQRLTLRRLELQLPTSMEQIDAERSLLQAQYVIRERQLERQVETVAASKARLLADLGRRVSQVVDLDERLEISEIRAETLEFRLAESAIVVDETTSQLNSTLTALDALKLAKSKLDREFETACARLGVFEARHQDEPDIGALGKRSHKTPAERHATPIDGWDEWADETALEALAPGQAAAYLRRRAESLDEDGAAELAALLGPTPLPLELAAACCMRTQTAFAAYAAKASVLMSVAPRRRDCSSSLAAAFSLAAAAAGKLNATAETLIAFMAYCAPERVPLALVEGVSDDRSESLSALMAATELSVTKLARFEDGTPAVSLRQPLHALARQRADETAGAGAVVERMIRRLLEIYPADGFGNADSWPLCAHLTPHLLSVCEMKTAGEELSQERADLLVRAGDYFFGREDYAAADSVFKAALAIREKAFGPRHPETAASLNNLASLLCAQGDLKGARPLMERARTIFQEAFGLDYPPTGRHQTNCARLLLLAKQPKDALALAGAALTSLRANVGIDHAWTIDAAHVAADACDALGKKKEAAALRADMGGVATTRNQRDSGRFVDYLLANVPDLLLVWTKGRAPRNQSKIRQ